MKSAWSLKKIFYVGSNTMARLKFISSTFIKNRMPKMTDRQTGHFQGSQNNLQTRPLGLLETWYHICNGIGMDNYVQVTRLSMQNPATMPQIKRALECLVKQYPIMRMTVKENKPASVPSFSFMEIKPFIIHLEELYCDDVDDFLTETLKTLHFRHMDMQWRFAVIRSDNEPKKIPSHFRHSLSIMFTASHAMFDGISLQYLHSDFIKYLDLVQRGYDVLNEITDETLPPAVENLIPNINGNVTQIMDTSLCRGCESDSGSKTHPLISAQDEEFLNENEYNEALVEVSPNANQSIKIESKEEKSKTSSAVEAYQNCFADEINTLRKTEQTTKNYRIKMSKEFTKDFISSCKHNETSVTGACIASSCVAMASLLKQNISADDGFIVIPIEFMVSLRRYITDQTLHGSYPGTAAFAIALEVRVPVTYINEGECSLWTVSRETTNHIESLLKSVNPKQELSSSIPKLVDFQKGKPKVGKSTYVVCFSNIKDLDSTILKSSLSERFRVDEYNVLNQVAVEHNPIFNIGACTLNKELEFWIGYCKGYTSETTTKLFAGNFRLNLEQLVYAQTKVIYK